jgi:signal transduction histidine kinase
VREWDATVRLAYFVFVVVGGAAIKGQRDSARAHVALLQRTQQLERQIIAISDREQQRIGRDLHDGICQYLAAIGFAASSLRRDLEEKAVPESTTAGEIARLLQDAVIQTRDLARGLSPVERDEGGLESALEELAASASRLLGVTCAFTGEIAPGCHNNTRDVHLFRIAQEALNNATKHGRASNIAISLLQAGPRLILQICDDGKGFNSEKTSGRGMGLSIMEYRARTIGGVLEISPNSPTGTIVSCTLPASLETIDSATVETPASLEMRHN